MRPPKEPKTWRYPRLYAGLSADGTIERMRIVYPSGKGDYDSGTFGFWRNSPAVDTACWVKVFVERNATEIISKRSAGSRDN